MRKNISFQKISSGKCRRNGKVPHRFAAPTRQWIWGMTINIHTETTGRSAGGDASRGVGPHRDKHAVLGREKHNGERMRKQRSSQAPGATRTTLGRTSCSCALTAVLGESGKCAAGLPGAVHGRPPTAPGPGEPTRSICRRPADTARLFHTPSSSGTLCPSRDTPWLTSGPREK